MDEDPTGIFVEDAIYEIAQLYRNRENYEKALIYLKRLINQFPDGNKTISAIEDMAELFYITDSYQKARTTYQALSKKVENDSLNKFYQSRATICLYRLGKIKLADKEANKFRKKYKLEKHRFAQFEMEKGNYYSQQKSFKNAIKIYNGLLKKYPTDPINYQARYKLGQIYFALKEDEKGLAILIKLVNDLRKNQPDNELLPWVDNHLAVYYYTIDRYQNAITAFKRVVDNPKSSEKIIKIAMESLVKMYESLRLYEAALNTIYSYLDRYPDTENTFDLEVKIGLLYRNSGQLEKAAGHFKDLLKRSDRETEAEIQFYIAESYHYMGKFELSVAEFLKVPFISKPSKLDWSTAAKQRAAESYVKLGRYDQAIHLYQEIIKQHGATSNYGRVARNRIDELRELLDAENSRGGF